MKFKMYPRLFGKICNLLLILLLTDLFLNKFTLAAPAANISRAIITQVIQVKQLSRLFS